MTCDPSLTMRDQIADALPKLPWDQHFAIALILWERCTLREVANILNMTEHDAMKIKTAALARLRTLIPAPSRPQEP